MLVVQVETLYMKDDLATPVISEQVPSVVVFTGDHMRGASMFSDGLTDARLRSAFVSYHARFRLFNVHERERRQ